MHGIIPEAVYADIYKHGKGDPVKIRFNLKGKTVQIYAKNDMTTVKREEVTKRVMSWLRVPDRVVTKEDMRAYGRQIL